MQIRNNACSWLKKKWLNFIALFLATAIIVYQFGGISKNTLELSDSFKTVANCQ